MSQVRVHGAYSVDGRVPSLWVTATPIADGPDGLAVGGMAQHFVAAQGELPRLARHLRGDVSIEHRTVPGTGRLLVFPSGSAVVLLSVDIEASAEEVIDLLQWTCDRRESTLLAGQPLLSALAPRDLDPVAGPLSLGGDIHHVVVLDRATRGRPTRWGPPRIDGRLAARFVYRSHAVPRRSFSAIAFPVEANRLPGSLVAVAHSGTVIAGRERAHEHQMLIACATVVNAVRALRGIRREAFGVLELMRADPSDRGDLASRRKLLTDASERLADLELELGSSVEAALDLEAVLPSQMLGHYHRALVRSYSLDGGLAATTALVARVRRGVSDRLEAVEGSERAYDDARQVALAKAGAGLAVLGTVAALAFGFFGANAAPVDAAKPFWSADYLPYAGVGAALVLALVAWIGREARKLRTLRRDP